MFLKFLRNLPVFVGAYTLTSVSYHNLLDAYNHFYRVRHKLASYFPQGSLILANATEGISPSIAQEFVVRGIPLILISHDSDSLAGLKEILYAKYGEQEKIDIKTIVFDPKNAELSQYLDLFDKIERETPELAGLVSNTGIDFFNEQFVRRLGDSNQEELRNSLEKHVLYGLFLQKYALHRLQKRSNKHKSLLLTVSSVFGSHVHANSGSILNATSAFSRVFAKSLRSELSKNFEVCVFEPGLCGNSAENKAQGIEKWGVADADEVAQESLGRLGYEKEVYGVFRHWIHHKLMKNLGVWVNYLNYGSVGMQE